MEQVVAEFLNDDATLKVSWEYIGEGLYGEFDHTDSMDEPLLRFYCYRCTAPDYWVEIEDASFCTQYSLDSDVSDLREVSYSRIFPALQQPNYRRILENITYEQPVVS